jgi:hypothetical protein
MFRIYILLIILSVTFASCRKLGLCKDDELTITRQANNSSSMKLNGYYYGISDEDSAYAQVTIFYRNGLIYRGPSYTIVEIMNNKVDLRALIDRQREIKSGWGIYKVNNGNIENQSWAFSQGCKPVVVEKWEILNDSTFRITSWKNTNSDKVNAINLTYRFRSYSPKPDSTNNFIE